MMSTPEETLAAINKLLDEMTPQAEGLMRRCDAILGPEGTSQNKCVRLAIMIDRLSDQMANRSQTDTTDYMGMGIRLQRYSAVISVQHLLQMRVKWPEFDVFGFPRK